MRMEVRDAADVWGRGGSGYERLASGARVAAAHAAGRGRWRLAGLSRVTWAVAWVVRKRAGPRKGAVPGKKWTTQRERKPFLFL